MWPIWRPARAARLFAELLLLAMVSACHGVSPYDDPAKPHHQREGFVNNYGPAAGRGTWDLLKWTYERTLAGLPKPPSAVYQGYAGFPVVKPDLEMLRNNRDRITVTWIGHATVLLQISGVNILFDPIFSDRTFMVQWAGPERKVALPMTLAELPHIDLVMISHNHYDHLDHDTVVALSRQAGGSPKFLVPLGVDQWMRDQGIDRVEAFDWWDSKPQAGLNIHFVPTNHWSARTLLDRNRTLWGGWVVKSNTRSFYFAGDTGYSKDFADIGRRLGPIDYAAIPVGAYEPRWFMRTQHVDPDESLKIADDVGARWALGMHWGTFELTDESLDQPILDLATALKNANEPPERFVLFKHGETRVLP